MRSNILTKTLKKHAQGFLRRNVGLASGAELAAVGAAALGTAVVVSELEKDHPEYARYELDSGGRSPAPLRAVFLTDLHEKEFGRDNERLLSMIRQADPDLVLIGGDMPTVKKTARTRNTLKLCRALAARWPVYSANGNHETRLDTCRDVYGDVYDAFRKELDAMGVVYLENGSAPFGDGVEIFGLDMAGEHYRPVLPGRMDAEYVRERLGEPDPSKYTVLLAHSPLFLQAYADWGADLVLAGHFHGGTIRLPGGIGLMTPQYQFFSPLVVGEKRCGLTRMLVSSGLGTHSVNIRINDRPQVVVADIVR